MFSLSRATVAEMGRRKGIAAREAQGVNDKQPQ